jgi:Ion channel
MTVYLAVKKFLFGNKSFSFLLVVLSIYVFVLIPLLTNSVFSQISFLLYYYVLLGSGIPFMQRRNQRLIMALLVIFPFLFLIIEISFASLWLQIFTDLFVVGYCIMLGHVILTRTFAKGRIDSKRVQGAVIAYLLISLVFCLVYHSIYLLSSLQAFKGLTGSDRKEFLYFSLTTLTTAGYGDIVPLWPFARSFSNLESLLGQLYPAVLIARLVSMEFYERTPHTEQVSDPGINGNG